MLKKEPCRLLSNSQSNKLARYAHSCRCQKIYSPLFNIRRTLRVWEFSEGHYVNYSNIVVYYCSYYYRFCLGIVQNKHFLHFNLHTLLSLNIILKYPNIKTWKWPSLFWRMKFLHQSFYLSFFNTYYKIMQNVLGIFFLWVNFLNL